MGQGSQGKHRLSFDGKPYIVSNPERILGSARFYQIFDHNLLFYKTEAVWKAVEELEQVENSESLTKQIESLRAEIHFTMYMQFKSLFALMLSIYEEDVPPVLHMMNYTNQWIVEVVKAFLNGEIEKITKGQSKTNRDFIIEAIYALKPNVKMQPDNLWEENIQKIARILTLLARWYLQGRGEYNSYKHGLRFYTGPTALYIKSLSGEPIFSSESPDSIVHIAKERDKVSGDFLLYEQTVQFDAGESRKCIHIMCALLLMIKQSRLSTLTKEPYPEVMSFHESFEESDFPFLVKEFRIDSGK